MTRTLVAALVAVVLGMTIAPADARPIRHRGDISQVPAPCGRFAAGVRHDCTVHVCWRRHPHHWQHMRDAWRRNHHRHHEWMRHQRHCTVVLPPLPPRVRSRR